MTWLLVSPASSLALTQAVHTLALGVFNFWATAWAAPSPARSAGIARANLDLWKLRRAYAQATETGSLEAVLDEARRLAPTAQDVARAATVWADLVEELMHDVEVRHGDRVSGSLKKLEVEGALLNWYRTSGLVLPFMPEVAQPLAIRIAADWSIEAIYALITQTDLWGRDAATAEPVPQSLLTRIGLTIGGWLGQSNGLIRLATSAAWWLVQKDLPITPHLRAATARAGAQTAQLAPKLGEDARQLMTWLDQHQTQVASVTRLVSVAVHEAEGLLEMTGSQKKEYATDLLLAFLIDEGLISAQGGLGYALANAVINWAIDATVQLFNKRQHFTHRRSPPVSVPAGPYASPSAPPYPTSASMYRSWAAPAYSSMASAYPSPAPAYPFAAGAYASASRADPLLQMHAAASRAVWDVVKQHLAGIADAWYPPGGLSPRP